MELKAEVALWIFHSNCLWTFIASKLYCVKEGISRYGFNRNLFEIIKWRIIYYSRMGREGGMRELMLMDVSGKMKSDVKIRNLW